MKTHEVPAHGEIAEISAGEGHGFIRVGERPVYFTRASVLNEAFDELEVGTPVAFVEENGGAAGEHGALLGKHHYVTY